MSARKQESMGLPFPGPLPTVGFSVRFQVQTYPTRRDLKTAPIKRPSYIGQPAVPPDPLWGYVTVRKPWCRGAGVCWNGAMRKLPMLQNLYFREHGISIPFCPTLSPEKRPSAPQYPTSRPTVVAFRKYLNSGTRSCLRRSRCNLESWQRSRFARTSNVCVLAVYFMCCVGALLLRSCCELVVSLERESPGSLRLDSFVDASSSITGATVTILSPGFSYRVSPGLSLHYHSRPHHADSLASLITCSHTPHMHT